MLAGTAALDSRVPIALAHRRAHRDRGELLPADDPGVPAGRAAPTSSPGRTSAGTRASSAGAALLIDYVLTVAVSVAAGIAADHLGDPGRSTPTGSRSACSAWPASRSGTSAACASPGGSSRVPTYLFVGAYVVMIGWGGRRRWRPGTATALAPPVPAGAHEALTAVPGAPRLLVRLRRADRDRGGLRRRAGLPAARGAERPPRARSRSGVILIALFLGISVPRARLRRRARRKGRR